ncbi:MAG: T9SS type A sorting domain-containing protein, partial [Bacteroidia bacterium]
TVSTPSSGFTANGQLKLRVVLIERNINFATAPGSNGEKDFHEVVRYVYDVTPATTPPAIPTSTITGFGINLSNTWVAGNTYNFSANLAVPSTVVSKGEMAFVAWIQDDGDRKVYQAARSSVPSIPNEAKALTAAVSASAICASTINATASIKNNGNNAITAMTITPYMNAVAGTPFVWTGNLAAGATTNIPLGAQSGATNGTNTFSYSITGVSGGDVVMSNNSASTTFYSNVSYQPGLANEGFEAAQFPPAGWAAFNPFNEEREWERATTASGFMTSSASIRNFINWTATNNYHDLYMPGADMTGTVNPALKFDMSYTGLNGSSNDKLEVQVSTNCGQTWTNAYMNQGASMKTTPDNASLMNTPNTAGQWSLVTVPLTSYAGQNIMVRFRLTAGAGNVMWLDNINLFDAPTTGINKSSESIASLEMYPNPAVNEVTMAINSTEKIQGNVTVVNALGQVVYNVPVSINVGLNEINVNTKEFATGIYHVTLNTEQGSLTKKLTVSK